jgi:DNA helicase-2/ATP-dependent DNA helicase PcrA
MDWILDQPEKFQHLYALKTFYTFVDKEASGKINFRVSDLLEICDLMRLYKIRLPVQELTAPFPGIHLSSLHGAKGLEFDKVLIKNITENEWEKKRGNHMKFSFPDNLVRLELLATTLESDMEIDDQYKRRLLYVGMTRAKQDLILSYALKGMMENHSFRVSTSQRLKNLIQIFNW